MATQRPASESAEVTPTEANADAVAPAVVATDPAPAAPDSTFVAPAVPVAPAAQQVVYVEAPKPFIAKGNRGFGILIALLSTVIFAAVYAVALMTSQLIVVNSVDFSFISTLDFYAPVLMFAVGFVIVVLIVNRAGWAAHVVGSIFVGVIVFFGGTAILLGLHAGQIPSNQVGEFFTRILFSSESIISAVVGREVALWMGFAIAARGRKVRARNVDARVLYDQEVAAKRAEYEQANARNATGPIEPVVAEPVVAEPVVSEPVAAEPVVADPPVAEPVATETTAP